MKLKELFPPTIKTVRDNKEPLLDIYRKKQIRYGDFVGICELEGSFLVEDPVGACKTLKIGEELVLDFSDEQIPYENVTVAVHTTEGLELGQLPYVSSVLPNALRRHGVSLFCYLECCEMEDGMLAIAVSLYCKGL